MLSTAKADVMAFQEHKVVDKDKRDAIEASKLANRWRAALEPARCTEADKASGGVGIATSKQFGMSDVVDIIVPEQWRHRVIRNNGQAGVQAGVLSFRFTLMIHTE